jgi:hypothetical protein
MTSETTGADIAPREGAGREVRMVMTIRHLVRVRPASNTASQGKDVT